MAAVRLLLLLALTSCRLFADAPERAKGREERATTAARAGKAKARPADLDAADPADPQGKAKEAEMLETIGYLEAEVKAEGASGVTVHDPARAQPGTNLVVSAHAREVAEMDMQGLVLRTWTLPKSETKAKDPTGFRRAFLTPDGGLLAVLEGHAMVRFSDRGAVLWRVDEHNHHDLVQLSDGTIVGLTRKARSIPALSKDQLVMEDRVTWFSADGHVIKHVSLLQALHRSPWWSIYQEAERKTGDVFHTNSVKVLDGAAAAIDPAFKAGNVLVSMLYPSTIAVLDPEAGEIVWTLTGKEFRHQHDAELLPDQRLQVFDNLGARPYSAVRVYDLATKAQVWSYEGSAERPFFTKNCGSAELLPNGNRLVVESNRGRAFELAPDGTIVWEWRSPFRGSKSQELVANLYDLVRVPSAP